MWYEVAITNCAEGVLDRDIFPDRDSALEFFNSDLGKRYPESDHVEITEVEVISARPLNREER